jgi:predicted transglutaminase-like cysteine proteinase
MPAWGWRSLAVVAAGICLSACQTAGAIAPGGGFHAREPGNTVSAITSSTVMPAGVRGPIPPGFVSFCFRFPSQCESPADRTEIITLSGETWALLVRVNRQANADIWPVNDLKHYGRGEYWNIPTDGYGDCEDFALTKRKLLMEAGLPERALRLATVTTARGESHAILTVATDRGDYVLDSMNDDILPWNRTGFRWIERQDGADIKQWVVFDRDGGQTASAAAY